MPQRLRWSELSLGLAALVLLIALAALTFLFAQVETLHGRTSRLYVTTNSVRGVLAGTPVWLDGQQIGLVRSIRLRPPQVDTANRLVVGVDVLARALVKIRRDARAQIRAGGSIIASPVIFISDGTPQAPALRPGDTLHATAETDMEVVTSQFAGAAREFPAIIANLKVLSAALQSTQGTLGALTLGGQGGDGETARLGGLELRGRRLLASVTGPGPTRRADSLASLARQTLAQADSVEQLLSGGVASLGRFRRDTTLLRTMRDVSARLGQLSSAAAEPFGSAGRFARDSELTASLSSAQRRLQQLMGDVRQHPFRYIYF